MKRTRSMYFNPTTESNELTLYAVNDYIFYTESIIPVITCLRKHFNRSNYDSEKAIDAFYRVAQFAAKRYNNDFGYKFTVNERYNAAIQMYERFKEDIEIIL